jgi:AcrR family transcriptional regulator
MKYEPRPYVMKARAAAAAATRERILASTRDLLLRHSFDEMTIEAIAAGAGTTVRTVLRIFSSKEQLFAEALHSLGPLGQAPVTPGDIGAMVSGTYDFYEKIGDTVIRWLADEPHLPAMREHLNTGRRHLRIWVGEAFAPALARRQGAERRQLHDALIIAFDVYTWKLLRRDFGLGRKAAEAVVRRIVAALTREDGDGRHAVAELVGRGQSAAQPRHRAGAE